MQIQWPVTVTDPSTGNMHLHYVYKAKGAHIMIKTGQVNTTPKTQRET